MPMNVIGGEWGMGFKEKCCYLRKRLTEHSSHKNFGSSKRLFQENEIVK